MNTVRFILPSDKDEDVSANANAPVITPEMAIAEIVEKPITIK